MPLCKAQQQFEILKASHILAEPPALLQYLAAKNTRLNPDRVTLVEGSSAIEQGAADKVWSLDDEWLAGPLDSEQIAVNAGDVGVRGKHVDLLFEFVALPSIV